MLVIDARPAFVDAVGFVPSPCYLWAAATMKAAAVNDVKSLSVGFFTKQIECASSLY